MDLVRMLRTLWQTRVLLGLVSVLAVAAGVGVMVSSSTTKVGTAHAMALVDTPNSQVVDLGGADSAASIVTLSNRATLLTGLMTSSPLTEEIAARAGIQPRTLIAESAVTQSTAGSSTSGSAPLTTGIPAGLSPLANVLTATVPSLSTGQVPIITVDTQSPTAAGAAKLADSSIAVLSEYLRSVAAQDKVPGGRRVIIRQLGPAVTSSTTNAPSKTLALAAAIGLFVLGCALIIGVSALKTGWRRAGEMERLEGEMEDLSVSWLPFERTAARSDEDASGNAGKADSSGTETRDSDGNGVAIDANVPADGEAAQGLAVATGTKPGRSRLLRPSGGIQWRAKRPPSTPG